MEVMTITYDYYYDEQSESFSFYRIPRQLITGAEFRNVSIDAKLLYGLMLDRMSLSAKNAWYDDKGRVYVYYTLDEIQENLGCGHDKAVKLLSELAPERGVGLIERVKQGQGRPSRIYVKQFISFPTENRSQTSKTGCADFGKQKSETSISRNADFGKTDTIYYYKIILTLVILNPSISDG